MLINRTIRPKNKRYLPPGPTPGGEGTAEDGLPYEDCGAIAPEEHFDQAWACTRAPDHEGDHAAHAGFLGKGKPVMVARWPREEETEELEEEVES